MKEFPEIKPMGEKALLLEFEPKIEEALLEQILFLKKYLKKKLVKEEVEVTNTYSSILISYPFIIEDVYGEVSALKKLLRKANIKNKIGRQLFHVPVCYDQKFGLDLEELAEQKKLSLKEIIRLHTAPVYTVYFIGFLPGFLYLGGLDEKLHFPRKEQPRLKVEKGAVGIGEKQTGIYPQTSPGGWQIIGRSPVPLFDRNSNPPCQISAGSKLKFYEVSVEEYERISEAVEHGTFSWKKEAYHD
ncbi:MAG: 5-oxoprolinase subunit PxpB [Salinimicrobium sp.]